MYKQVTQREIQNDHKRKKTRSLTENRLVLVMIIISCILAYQKKKNLNRLRMQALLRFGV